MQTAVTDPSPMPQLLLIRHGETALNAARVLQPADTPLSGRGLAQANALAARLANAGIASVLSSDLPRARQTADAIANACGAAVTTSPLLHERNFGDLRGRPYDTLGFDPLEWPGAPPNGESQAAFDARTAAAWNEVVAYAGRCGGTVAVVSHGLVIRAWLDSGQLSLPPGVVSPRRLGNTSLTIADATPPHRVRLLNCTAHLEGEAAEDAHSLSGG